MQINRQDPLFTETQLCEYNRPRVIYTSDPTGAATASCLPLISIIPSFDSDILEQQLNQDSLRQTLATSHQKMPQARYDIVLELPLTEPISEIKKDIWIETLQKGIDKIMAAQAILPAQTRWIYKTNTAIVSPVLYIYVFQ